VWWVSDKTGQDLQKNGLASWMGVWVCTLGIGWKSGKAGDPIWFLGSPLYPRDSPQRCVPLGFQPTGLRRRDRQV
jgi:hypothetical protein